MGTRALPIGRIVLFGDHGQRRARGPAIPRTAWLLAARALGRVVAFAPVLLRGQRTVLFALLAEKPLPKVFDGGVLERELPLQLLELDLCVGMLRFPGAGSRPQVNVLLFADRYPFPS